MEVEVQSTDHSQCTQALSLVVCDRKSSNCQLTLERLVLVGHFEAASMKPNKAALTLLHPVVRLENPNQEGGGVGTVNQ